MERKAFTFGQQHAEHRVNKKSPSCFTLPLRAHLSLPTGNLVLRYLVMYWQESKWYLTLQPIRHATEKSSPPARPTFGCSAGTALLLVCSHILGPGAAATRVCYYILYFEPSHLSESHMCRCFSCFPAMSFLLYIQRLRQEKNCLTIMKLRKCNSGKISDLTLCMCLWPLQRGNRAVCPLNTEKPKQKERKRNN